jgi:hypothetical protein
MGEHDGYRDLGAMRCQPRTVGRPLSVLRVDIRQYQAFLRERTACPQLYAGNRSTVDWMPDHLDLYPMSTPHLAQSCPAVAAVSVGAVRAVVLAIGRIHERV